VALLLLKIGYLLQTFYF